MYAFTPFNSERMRFDLHLKQWWMTQLNFKTWLKNTLSQCFNKFTSLCVWIYFSPKQWKIRFKVQFPFWKQLWKFLYLGQTLVDTWWFCLWKDKCQTIHVMDTLNHLSCIYPFFTEQPMLCVQVLPLSCDGIIMWFASSGTTLFLK